jgi:hypothetical protein
MADLNEVAQFEQDLKKLIDERNNFVPNYDYKSSHTLREQKNQTKKPVSEEGVYKNEWYKFDENNGMVAKMIVREHGQPYKTPICDQSFMIAKEHGQPCITINMAVREHGQPYKTPRCDQTYMIAKEHGQPYMMTNMAVREHGRPFQFKDRKSEENWKDLSSNPIFKYSN